MKMRDFNIIFAGFGGQGILFAGKVVASAGLVSGKNVSWLPSYGPEMRGGTANCSVCIADDEIGSPLVTNPNVLIAMNLPSFNKFIDSVETGGIVIIDSSLIKVKVQRDDLNVHYVDATNLATEAGLKGLANVIMVGKLHKEIAFCSEEILAQAINKSIPSRKEHLKELNIKALQIGMQS